MNYLKRIGRLVAICICAVCVGIIPITAHAMEVSDKQIQPRMDYISSYGTELTISDSGEASVTGFVREKRVTNAYVKVTLQKRCLDRGCMCNHGNLAVQEEMQL